MEVYVDDDSKLTLHGLQQHYCKLKDNEKNRKLFELLDVLEFNQVNMAFSFQHVKIVCLIFDAAWTIADAGHQQNLASSRFTPRANGLARSTSSPRCSCTFDVTCNRNRSVGPTRGLILKMNYRLLVVQIIAVK